MSIKYCISVTVFYHEILRVIILPHSSYQDHSFSLDLSNAICRGAQNAKLINMHFSLSSYFHSFIPIMLPIKFSNSHCKH
jgi:hypothetical protein